VTVVTFGSGATSPMQSLEPTGTHAEIIPAVGISIELFT